MINQETHKKKRKKTKFLIGLIAVLLIAGLLAGYFLKRKDDFFDPAAQTGILPGMSEEEIQAELNRVVEEGMLNINIASEIFFADSKAKGLANISNSEANQYLMTVSVVLNDTGETVYESGGLKPGQYIQYITLDEKLDPGVYPATATFTAYTQKDRKVVGNVAAELTLYVDK